MEYLVHLCEIAMYQGKQELILKWSIDVFTWLSKYDNSILPIAITWTFIRRNEILLSAKSPQVHKPEISKDPPPPSKTLSLGANLNQSVGGIGKQVTTGGGGGERTSRGGEQTNGSQKMSTVALTSRPMSVRKAERVCHLSNHLFVNSFVVYLFSL